jgi:hypothetical protein
MMRTLKNSGKEEKIPSWFLRSHKKQKNASAAGSDSAPYTSRKQIPISTFMPPKLTPAKKGKFQQHLVLYFFVTGSAFQRVEDDNLKAAIKVLRLDDGLLPDRKILSGALLEQCYPEIKAKCDKFLRSSTSFSCLILNAWSNILNESIVNYMVTIPPRKSLFLEAVATGQHRHTSEWIATDIERVITQKYQTRRSRDRQHIRKQEGTGNPVC